MSVQAPLVLHLYGDGDEVIKTFSRSFVPWKLLKMAVGLQKQIGSKPANEYDEADIDALAGYVVSVFGQDLTVELLDEHSDVSEMIAVIQSVVSRARGIMDPTLPPRA